MNSIAAIQMASGSNVQGNLTEAGRLIAAAASAGAKVIVLPENFSHMGMEEEDKIALAEVIGHGSVQEFISEQAKKYQVWIIAGTIPIKSDDPSRVYASCLIFNELGEQVYRYDKYHLFDVQLTATQEYYLESSTIKAGNQLIWFDSPLGRIGLAICYDIRFPELFRKLMEHKIDIFAVPSAFTATTGAAHWESLIRSRAIENLSYVVAANQGGYHVNGRETHGDSMIVDPWGNIVDRLARGSGFVLANIDLKQIQSIRENFPVLLHRRINIGNHDDG